MGKNLVLSILIIIKVMELILLEWLFIRVQKLHYILKMHGFGISNNNDAFNSFKSKFSISGAQSVYFYHHSDGCFAVGEGNCSLVVEDTGEMWFYKSGKCIWYKKIANP